MNSKKLERDATGWAIVMPFKSREAAEDTARWLLHRGYVLFPKEIHLRPAYAPGALGDRVEIDAEPEQT